MPRKTRSKTAFRGVQKKQKDPCRFYCPWKNCTRSTAELWRLKVHFRANPDNKGSGVERGHGCELSHCPRCGDELEANRHHIGCRLGLAAPRQALRRELKGRRTHKAADRQPADSKSQVTVEATEEDSSLDETSVVDAACLEFSATSLSTPSSGSYKDIEIKQFTGTPPSAPSSGSWDIKTEWDNSGFCTEGSMEPANSMAETLNPASMTQLRRAASNQSVASRSYYPDSFPVGQAQVAHQVLPFKNTGTDSEVFWPITFDPLDEVDPLDLGNLPPLTPMELTAYEDEVTKAIWMHINYR